MDLDEAMMVAHIASSADHGCPVCVRDLHKQLRVAFPEFKWNLDEDRNEPYDIPPQEFEPDDCTPTRPAGILVERDDGILYRPHSDWVSKFEKDLDT